MYFCLNGVTIGGGGPLEQFVQLAADSGFPGCDVDVGYGVQHGAAALSDLFARHKLKMGGWGPGDWRGDMAKHAAALEQLTKQAAVARQVGADSCSTWLLPTGDVPFMENWKFHVDRLAPFARVLADAGLRLGLEFVAPYHIRRAKAHEFVFTAGQMLELAAAVGPNVGLLVDSFHVYTSGDPFSRLATIPKDKIVLVHINDAPPGAIHEQKDGNRLLPGKGVMDLKAFLAALKQAGYDGPVSLEVFSDELKKMPKAESSRLAWESLKPLVP